MNYFFQPQNIPVIDISPYTNDTEGRATTASLIRETCKQTGFFYIINHGVSLALQKSLMAHTQQFFSLPRQEKLSINMSKGGRAWRGYFEVGQELTSGKIDLKEGLYLGQELPNTHPCVESKLPMHGANLFPSSLPELKQDILAWLQEMSRLGDCLLQAIAESLGLNRYFFRESVCRDHLGLLRLFHYPPDDKADPDLWAVGEHTDYGLLTILLISEVGLEVKNRKDEWVKVDPLPDSFVINIGDILEKMTRGLYKSTPHRARNVLDRSRYSIPYFYDPNWHAEICELPLEVTAEELELLRQTQKSQRWDNVSLERISGSYGNYILGKVGKVFPQLAQEALHQ